MPARYETMPALPILLAVLSTVFAVHSQAQEGVLGGMGVLQLETLAGPGADADEASAANEALSRSLSALELVEICHPDSLARRLADAIPGDVGEDLARAQDYIVKGRKDLQERSLNAAADSFQTARVLLRKNLQWLDDPEPLIAALMGLAAVLGKEGRWDEARAAYLEILALSPEYEPHPGQVPGEFRPLFEEALELSAQELAGSLTVISKPDGAAVILDGLTMGRTPLVMGNVPAGIHALKIEKEGFYSARLTAEASAGESAVLELKLEALPVDRLLRQLRGALSGSSRRQEIEKAARELARGAGLRAVLLSQLAAGAGGRKALTVAAVAAEEDRIYLYGELLEAGREEEIYQKLAWQVSAALDGSAPPGDPPRVPGFTFERRLLGEPAPEQPVGLVPALTAAAGEAGAGIVPPMDRPPRPPDENGRIRDPLWGKWWFWAGLGTVVAAGIATTLALTLGPGTETIKQPDWIHVVVERAHP